MEDCRFENEVVKVVCL